MCHRPNCDDPSFNNHNNNDFLCANIIEDRAQWCNKTKELTNLVIIYQCAIRRLMYEGARNLRKIGSFKEIGFRRRRNEATVTSNLILAENEF